jgi:hypothetical protein
VRADEPGAACDQNQKSVLRVYKVSVTGVPSFNHHWAPRCGRCAANGYHVDVGSLAGDLPQRNGILQY